MENELIRLKIKGITYNQIENGMYAVVLEEESGVTRLPIIIGYNEAQSIECLLQKITTPRPLTHELMARILESFDIKIVSVVIKHLSNGIFTADVMLEDKAGKRVLDARSSDAIALSMRLNAPIYTTRDVLDKCGIAREAFASSTSRTIANQSIAVRQAIERVKKQSKTLLGEHTIGELNEMMQQAVKEENYEQAAEIKKELESRINNKKNASKR